MFIYVDLCRLILMRGGNRDTGCKMQDARYRIQDAGYRMQDTCDTLLFLFSSPAPLEKMQREFTQYFSINCYQMYI